MNWEEKVEELIKFLSHNKIDKDIVVWGTGIVGKRVLQVLQYNKIKVFAVIDSEKRQDEILGTTVYTRELLCNKKAFVIVAIASFYEEILNFLFDNGYSSDDIYYLFSNGYEKNDILYKGCKIGRYTYGYKYLLKDFPMAESIGRYCSINSSARIVNNHSLDCITTSPILDNGAFFFFVRLYRTQTFSTKIW